MVRVADLIAQVRRVHTRATEELHVVSKSFRADVKGAQVERFDLSLIKRRVNQTQRDGGIDIEFNFAF
ncbi:MAG: hypothetical protein CMJ78_27490 [Planctomycetaceae bacterium]|nr:hypothetical protein [Planctomycetaceae bacterium]